VTCPILHNMMLDEMVCEQAPPRVGCGCCVLDDCVWLDGHTELSMKDKNPCNAHEKHQQHEFHR
jgi:hypothetical protein